jgi:hypothetical protein
MERTPSRHYARAMAPCRHSAPELRTVVLGPGRYAPVAGPAVGE